MIGWRISRTLGLVRRTVFIITLHILCTTGKFDLIQCSGVLHHLSNPQEGLNILSEALAEKGGAAIMVYAQ